MAERNCCSYINVLSNEAREKELVRVACLYRVSTNKQVDHNDENRVDIPVQRIACHEFCDRMGWTIVIEEIEDGVSGFKISANDRDKIKLLRQYAEEYSFTGHITINICREKQESIPDLIEIAPIESFEILDDGIRIQ